MNAKDKMLFCKLLTNVAELYGKPLSPGSLEIYWNTLESYPLENIRRAINLHAKNTENGQFMPKPADILRYLEMNNTAKSMRAWDRVLKAIREKGAHSSMDFDDPAIHAVIAEMGGWIALCHDSKDNKLPFMANEFQRRYSIYLIYPLPQNIPDHLWGIAEHQNSILGYPEHIPKPVLFSKKETTLMIETFNTEEK